MIHIALTYYTGQGHTKKLAESIADGLRDEEKQNAILIDVEKINEEDWLNLHQADAILFGSPTYMGGVAASFKTFMDQSGQFWLEQRWADKLAGGFTVSTSPSGDKLGTLSSLALFAAQHGMIWVGQSHIGSLQTQDGLGLNEPGSWLGLMATSDPDKTQLIPSNDQATARLFGERMGLATQRWVKQV